MDSNTAKLQQIASQEGAKAALLGNLGLAGSVLSTAGLAASGLLYAYPTIPALAYAIPRVMSLPSMYRSGKANAALSMINSKMPEIAGQTAALQHLNKVKAQEVAGLQEAANSARNVKSSLPMIAAAGVGLPAVWGLKNRMFGSKKPEEKEKKASALMAGLLATGAGLGTAAMALRSFRHGFGEGAEALDNSAQELETAKHDNAVLEDAAHNLSQEAHGFGSLKHPGTWVAAAAIPYLGYKAYNWASGDGDKEKKAFVEKLASDVSQAVVAKAAENPGVLALLKSLMSKGDKWLSTSFWSPYNLGFRLMGAGGSVGNLQAAFKKNTTSYPRMFTASLPMNAINHGIGGLGAAAGASIGSNFEHVPGAEAAAGLFNQVGSAINPHLAAADSLVSSLSPGTEPLDYYMHVPQVPHLESNGTAIGAAVGLLAGNLLGSIPTAYHGKQIRKALDKTYGSTRGNISDTINRKLFGDH